MVSRKEELPSWATTCEDVQQMRDIHRGKIVNEFTQFQYVVSILD